MPHSYDINCSLVHQPISFNWNSNLLNIMIYQVAEHTYIERNLLSGLRTFNADRVAPSIKPNFYFNKCLCGLLTGESPTYTCWHWSIPTQGIPHVYLLALVNPYSGNPPRILAGIGQSLLRESPKYTCWHWSIPTQGIPHVYLLALVNPYSGNPPRILAGIGQSLLSESPTYTCWHWSIPSQGIPHVYLLALVNPYSGNPPRILAGIGQSLLRESPTYTCWHWSIPTQGIPRRDLSLFSALA